MNLDKVPYGVYVDETSIGENAYLISHNGYDEWGKSWPVFFKAFGEYKNPLFIYSTALLFKFAAPSIWLLRFSSTLWGIITILATAWAVYELTRSKWLAYAGAIALTLMPWHIHASRVVFEAITFPAFMAVIIASVIRYVRLKNLRWLTLASASIGLAFYSYTAARLFSPLFLVAFALLTLKIQGWKHALLAIFTSFIIWAPAINFEIENPGSLLARYKTVAGHNVVKTYLHQFDYRLWLTTGDGNLRHTPARGMLPHSLLIPFAIGFIYLCLHWRLTQSQVLLFLFFTAPLAAAMTRTDPIALRMIHLIPVLIVISVIGIKAVYSQKKFLLAIVGIVMFVEFILFSRFYVNEFPKQAYAWFDGSFYDAYPLMRSYPTPILVHTSVHSVTGKYLDRVYSKDKLPPLQYRWNSQFEYTSSYWNVYFDEQCNAEVAGTKPVWLTRDSCILPPSL